MAPLPAASSNRPARTRQRPSRALRGRVHQVGHAQEVGDEQRLGILVDVLRSADLLDLPPFMTASRSDIVSASSWSCVT